MLGVTIFCTRSKSSPKIFNFSHEWGHLDIEVWNMRMLTLYFGCAFLPFHVGDLARQMHKACGRLHFYGTLERMVNKSATSGISVLATQGMKRTHVSTIWGKTNLKMKAQFRPSGIKQTPYLMEAASCFIYTLINALHMVKRSDHQYTMDQFERPYNNKSKQCISFSVGIFLCFRTTYSSTGFE